MSVTAKQIAKELNISAAAVSMALNNKPGVSTETRKIVIELQKSERPLTKILGKANIWLCKLQYPVWTGVFYLGGNL